MANPQLENGYFRIANEIVEALIRTNLSSYQSRILWAILRKTYGYAKKEDRISLSQLAELTGLRKQHVWRSFRELRERNLVTKRGYFIAFNKDYQQWRELPKGVTSHKSNLRGLRGNLKGLPKVTKRGDHKRQKTILQKTSAQDALLASFNIFYKAYPKRKARRDAERAWIKLNPDSSLTDSIMTALEKQKVSKDWLKDNGKFIPYPATWLNDRRWEDELPEESRSRWA